jgi:hypothetical protein
MSQVLYYRQHWMATLKDRHVCQIALFEDGLNNQGILAAVHSPLRIRATQTAGNSEKNDEF